METFIRNDQFNLVRQQVEQLIANHASVNDIEMIYGLKSLAEDKILTAFEELSADQEEMLKRIRGISDEIDGELYLAQLKPYVKPFKNVDESRLKKLFPKVKHLKMPDLEGLNLKETSYLGWNDKSRQTKYLVVEQQDQLQAIKGSFTESQQEGICSICNKMERIGLFVADAVGRGQGTYVKRGNYLCADTKQCNHNLTKLDKLDKFVETIKRP